jgi:hypothetical protein
MEGPRPPIEELERSGLGLLRNARKPCRPGKVRKSPRGDVGMVVTKGMVMGGRVGFKGRSR